MMRINMKQPILWIMAGALIFFVSSAQSQETGEGIDTASSGEVNLVKGELETLKVYNLTRLSITDPSVADIVDADEEAVLIIGQQIGQAVLFIWDDQGKRNIVINVINRDLDRVNGRISNLLRSADIHELSTEVNHQEGKIVVSGQIPEKKRLQWSKIILPFSEDIIDLVKDEEIEDLVQVDLQISELNTTLTKSLGIDWSTGDSAGINPVYDETPLDYDGTPQDFFKIGTFARTNALRFSVQALLEEGRGRILSQPKLVVVSGKEASFLVGGEIPIRTTTSTEGAVQENVSFKEFGISMNITPTIIRGDKIDVIMGLEVSDVDAANAVGDDVAFATRSADTQLIVDDGQTVIMAGLIKESESEQIKKVPFISEIPILGLLFRSRSTPSPNQDTELVIMMTPHILRSSSTAEEEQERFVDTEGTIAKHRSKAKPYYSGIPSEMMDYVRQIQDKIAGSLNYPPEAVQYGWEGTVKVNMLILHDGTLAFALVRESSGHDLIDEHALEIARGNAPFSAFPSGTNLQELNVTIPIVYSLKRN